MDARKMGARRLGDLGTEIRPVRLHDLPYGTRYNEHLFDKSEHSDP